MIPPHFELYWRGIISFAEYTWAGDRRSIPLVKEAYRHREFSSSLSNEEFAFIDKLEQPVAFWKNALLKKHTRNRLRELENPMEEAIVDFPDPANKGMWSKENAEKIQNAKTYLQICDSIAIKIATMKNGAIRNTYTLEVYEQVNKMARFAATALLALEAFDKSQTLESEKNAIEIIKGLSAKFAGLRQELEEVYSKTRRLSKPNNYILDQDHHHHLANQSISFDWQFYAEILFLEKVALQVEHIRVTNDL